jgi:hypothetical protein
MQEAGQASSASMDGIGTVEEDLYTGCGSYSTIIDFSDANSNEFLTAPTARTTYNSLTYTPNDPLLSTAIGQCHPITKPEKNWQTFPTAAVNANSAPPPPAAASSSIFPPAGSAITARQGLGRDLRMLLQQL